MASVDMICLRNKQFDGDGLHVSLSMCMYAHTVWMSAGPRGKVIRHKPKEFFPMPMFSLTPDQVWHQTVAK